MSRAEFYRLVSGVIRNCMLTAESDDEREAYAILTHALASAFERHNTKFDRARFYRDAGLTTGA